MSDLRSSLPAPFAFLAGAVSLLVAMPLTAQTEVREGLVYANASGVDLALDVAIPAGSGPHPGILYLHGGGWSYTILLTWGTLPI